VHRRRTGDRRGLRGGRLSPYRVTRFADADSFRERALDFLSAREAEHNLILGLSSQLRSTPNLYGAEPPFLAVVEDAGTVTLAALRTPPNKLVLSGTTSVDAVRAISDDLGAERAELPGVLAEPEVARSFADAWSERTGVSFELATRERIYRLESVTPPRPAPGRLRVARVSDRELLIDWLVDFWTEAVGGASREDGVAGADRWLAGNERTMYLWEDHGVVSMCGAGGPTPSGIRIGPVFTPRALRARGYASACVAAVSQLQLDSGRTFCFLYTNLANPTSNHIYQAIGYQPVCDADEYHFG